MTPAAVITIEVDPFISLGPVTLAWHGIMTAVGIIVGAWLAAGSARAGGSIPGTSTTRYSWCRSPRSSVARLFFLALEEPSSLLHPAEWLGLQGFAIYGGILFGAAAAAVYVRRARLDPRYLDALASGFPLGLAVGRIGDVINGEHYGPPSDLPLAIRHVHPDADVPSAAIAYHPGGLYEVMVGLALLSVVLWLRDRLRRPTMLLWTVIALYGAGRFMMFFYRQDTEQLALGLNVAQATSLAFVAAGAVGALCARRTYPPRDRPVGAAKPLAGQSATR